MNSPEDKNERLAQALRATEKNVFVPLTLDESILKQSRAEFEKVFPKRPQPSSIASILRRLGWIIAPALALIIITFLLLPSRTQKFAREDINRDGQVDILDALTLARAIESKSNGTHLDQNGDRKLNDDDVNAIAMAAVRLDQEL